MKRRTARLIISAAGLMILILDTSTAYSGAKEGVRLCLESVLPSLLPFCVLSILLTSALQESGARYLRPLCALCKIPAGAEGLLICALIGGYPVGAQNVALLYRQKVLDKATAQRLLMYCSNAGPSFIFGIVASAFPQRNYGLLLWGVQILSFLLMGAFLPGNTAFHNKKKIILPVSFADAVHIGMDTMGKVCAWVVLFRVGIAYLDKWVMGMLPAELQVFLSGGMELTIGCCSLEKIESVETRFVIASAMLSFGGLCVTTQTGAVVADLGLRSYCKGKLMQTIISCFLSVLLLRQPWTTVILVCAALLLRESKNRGRNSVALGV